MTNIYRHYRTNKNYEVLGCVIHSETYEEMVLYKGLYTCDKFGENPLFVRPKKMFFEDVDYNGCVVPRFRRIERAE
jgi:hypothetical protein